MSVLSPAIDPLSAELPPFSVDWRFLLPLRRGSRLLAVTEAGQRFAPYFVGLDVLVVSCLTRSSMRASGGTAGPAGAVVFDPDRPPFAAGTFDMLVMPFGFPASFLHAFQAGDRAARDLLRPGGVLLAGTSNRWSLWRRARRDGADQAGLARFLRRLGFDIERIYASFPSLEKPAYILPLTQQAIAFMLRHRYAGRRLGRFVSLLALPLPAAWITHLLPAYFLVARSGREDQ